MRQWPYNLHAAATALETWVGGKLVAAPLLDVSLCFMDAPGIVDEPPAPGPHEHECVDLAPQAGKVCVRKSKGLARRRPAVVGEASDESKLVYTTAAQLVEHNGLGWAEAIQVAERCHAAHEGIEIVDDTTPIADGDAAAVEEIPESDAEGAADDAHEIGADDYDIFE